MRSGDMRNLPWRKTSSFVESVLVSTLLAVWGASSFWSIGELFEQRKRVEKGWFPKRENKD